jgi:hypothetical protein
VRAATDELKNIEQWRNTNNGVVLIKNCQEFEQIWLQKQLNSK